MKTALQLYTIRDCIKDKASFYEALEKVSTIGYEGVEFAGFHDAPAAELKAKLAQLSLAPVSCHVGGDMLTVKLDETIAYLNELGCKNMALAWYDTSSTDKTKEACQLIANAKAKANEKGINFYYHNHDHEFRANDGVLPIEEIKKVCALEVDTFWTFVAGEKSVDYLTQNKANIGLVHIKDGTKSTKTPCALGEGENDIKGIYDTTKALGYEWIIVENDLPTPNGIEDITRSIKFIKSL